MNTTKTHNNPFGIYSRTYEIIIETLKKFPQIEKACIFGSRAMGNYRKGSDIDIVIFGDNIDSQLVRRLNFILNEQEPIPYFIDVVHYESIKNIDFKNQIDKHCKIFYKNDASRRKNI